MTFTRVCLNEVQQLRKNREGFENMVKMKQKCV